MDFLEVEGKTYEEAVKKASLALHADEKDLDIEVTEVDTKGILGLLGSKKVRITARVRNTREEYGVTNIPEQQGAKETPEEYGKKFLTEVAALYGISIRVEVGTQEDRVIFSMETANEEALTGEDGEVLEALQHLVKLAIAKKFKENLKLLLDVNGFRERRQKTIVVMAKRLADKVSKEGRPIKTKPLNPFERRIVHTLFKDSTRISTHSEGEGHTKKVVISPAGSADVPN